MFLMSFFTNSIFNFLNAFQIWIKQSKKMMWNMKIKKKFVALR